ncbi:MULTISPECIES: outer membrane beta-barrel protein [unclassified Methylobacterium]|uniref:outer membrane beta-barrel protein n=2 Tax=Methylobacterium TaxID=407 RepID=UPI001FF04425|nr:MULTISPECIES: outer membrane beta-barrel protein [unclassified Methylobacterium]
MLGLEGEGHARREAGLACGLALLLAGLPAAVAIALPRPAQAQATRFESLSPVAGQPDNPGIGQDPGQDGLPVLRRNRLSEGPPRLGNGNSGEAAGGESSGGLTSGGASLSGPTGAEAGASNLDTRVRSSGSRTGGATSGTNNRAPISLLRQRAAPPRRLGTATKRYTQDVTQIPAPALRLSPVIQNPVVGVPLPAEAPRPQAPGLPLINPLSGVLTPGALLTNSLRRPIATEDAYAPLGIRLGSFTVLPSFTQSLGYDTNPDQTTPSLAKGSVALRSEGELNFRSDWSRSELAGELRAGYLETPENEAASRPNAAGTVRLRIDANRDLRIDAETRFLVDTQRTGSPNLQAVTATNRPIVATYGTSLGATETFNRLSVSLRGSVDRSEFEDARLSDGTVISQADRNQNQYSMRLRTAYEVTPEISPFVELLADTRVYDLRRDTSGLRRDSDGIAASVGATVNFTRSISGEISGGLQHRTYVDPSLRGLDAPILAAALVWAATPLTTVRLNAQAGVTETTVPGSSGILTQTATLEVQHDLLRNLSIIVGGAYLRNDYQGVSIRETGFSATARLDYRFNRWLTLRGTYLYQEITSTAATASFSDNTFLLGLRVNP